MKTLSRGLAGRNPPGGLVETVSQDFPDPDGLSRSMAAAGVPCNTYFSLLEEPGWKNPSDGRMPGVEEHLVQERE